ncbi:hypothetical protein [Phytohabitans rumicis]|uniref:Uncharacterized protein n=1 Tax=Phytohabitans rumicis TaxID=1076125 RepID=A0A6V8LIR5_9ACTN|nr:hypothetical protein [Phytohabitans rumicis]GFJ96094.1 hypothetical protein Prum_097360 [Phytohabitans rumicis]
MARVDTGNVCCVLVIVAVVVGAFVYFLRQNDSTGSGTASWPDEEPSYAAQPRGADGLPVNVISMVARFGRYTMEPPNAQGEDPSAIYDEIIAPLYVIAQADPDGFLVALRDKVMPVGGWAVLGASRVLWEVLTSEQREHPVHDELLGAALNFLRERGVPNLLVKGYEWRYWLSVKGDDERWLTGRPKPSPEQAPIPDLDDGELRRLIQVFPEKNSNLIFVRRHPDGGYVSVVDARRSDDDPTRVQWEDKRAASLNDLYWEIGCVFQTPTYWYRPEMGPYFPLPRPRLD